MTPRRGGFALLWFLAAALLSGCAALPGAGGASSGPGATGIGPGWSKRMEDRRMALERGTRGTNIEITRTADNQLKLVVPSDIAFDPNGYALKPGLRSVLDRFAGLMAGDRSTQLTVVGHTDTSGGDAVNNPLSLDRAQSVRDYLVGRGMSATQIRTVGRGAREPIADNATEAGRARNRRVEMFLAEPGSAA